MIQVGLQIADHKFLLAHVPCPEITSLRVVRKRFNLRRAEWSNLKDSLKKIDWTALKKGSADDAAKYFLEMLWFTLCNHIPYEEVSIHKRSHPWLNQKCEEAINAKNAAESTENYAEMRQKCTEVLTGEYQKHLAQLKDKISNLKKGSKEWWRLNRELLDKKSKCSSIPPLRTETNG